MGIKDVVGQVPSFLVDSWRYLAWMILAALVLEWILANVGLPAFWLYRAGRKRGGKRVEPMGPAAALAIGLLAAIGVFGLAFGAWLVNRWVSFGFQVVVCALLLDARRLMQIGDDILYLMQNNRLDAARAQIGRFADRNTYQMPPYEMIGLTISAQKNALPAAAVGPLFFMMLGGAPLALLAKFVLVADWKAFDPFSRRRHTGAGILFGAPSELLSALLLRLAALIMGFRYRNLPIRGVKYRLSDLERNGRHVQVAALLMAMLAADLLIIVRVILDQVFL